MAKAIRCRDVGVDCDCEANANTTEELLQKCVEHARSAHGLTQIPPEIIARVQSAIRDV